MRVFCFRLCRFEGTGIHKPEVTAIIAVRLYMYYIQQYDKFQYHREKAPDARPHKHVLNIAWAYNMLPNLYAKCKALTSDTFLAAGNHCTTIVLHITHDKTK